uniref:Uncharacterized protein n=1 Tax=Nelumbo nucifera TaxID=4432 RepID=A0A822YT20_NELNU|nr:TPA_asm: hypothetical protein HUJ06_006432 [Nelumbo nucifera]
MQRARLDSSSAGPKEMEDSMPSPTPRSREIAMLDSPTTARITEKIAQLQALTKLSLRILSLSRVLIPIRARFHPRNQLQLLQVELKPMAAGNSSSKRKSSSSHKKKHVKPSSEVQMRRNRKRHKAKKLRRHYMKERKDSIRRREDFALPGIPEVRSFSNETEAEFVRSFSNGTEGRV